MVRNGYMNGVAADTFDVEGSLTRAQLVTILYRIAGEPETSAAIPFADVADGQWYTKAIVWAAENGIVKGVNETTFARTIRSPASRSPSSSTAMRTRRTPRTASSRASPTQRTSPATRWRP